MPQSESVRALDKSLKNSLQRLYHRVFRPQLDPHTREVAEVLLSIPLFESFSNRSIRNTAGALHVRRYKRDEYIYRERDPSLGMYIIQEGRVRLVTEDDNGIHELRLAGDLDVFGELALFGDFRRLETAQAITETTVLGFFRPELKTMIKREPQSAAMLLAAMAGYLAQRHVGLCALLAEKEGKLTAMRMMDAAVHFPESRPTGSSLVVRP